MEKKLWKNTHSGEITVKFDGKPILLGPGAAIELPAHLNGSKICRLLAEAEAEEPKPLSEPPVEVEIKAEEPPTPRTKKWPPKKKVARKASKGTAE